MRKIVITTSLILLATTAIAEDGGGTGSPTITELLNWFMGLFS